MLHFFRRYQKIFFFFIAIVTIISFSFFGTYSAFFSGEKGVPVQVGIAREVTGLSRFLETSANDSYLLRLNKMPNLLNDGVVEKDLLATGIAEMLAWRDSARFDKEVREHLRTGSIPYGHSAEEWLGSTFLECSAEFILNAAIFAEKQGYVVTEEEARADLLHNVYKAGSFLQKGFSMGDAQRYLAQSSLQLGFDERCTLEIWRKVLLFRRLLQEAANTVVPDRLSQGQFHQYAQMAARVQLYELPPALQLKSFQDMLALQVYLEAVSPSFKRESLDLPQTLLSAEEVAEKYPELVEQTFTLDVSEVRKGQLLQEISLRQTWDWEVQEENWEEVCRKCPPLQKLSCLTMQERSAALEGLDEKQRFALDEKVRETILSAHPEWIEEAFKNGSSEQKKLGLRLRGGHFPFEGIVDRAQFLTRLGSAPLGQVQRFSDSFCQITVIEREEKPHLLTFMEALQDGTLLALLDQKLNTAYLDARRKDPSAFQLPQGGYKPMSEVRDQIGAYLYEDLLRAIAHAAGRKGEKLPLDFYPAHRFYKMMEQARDAMQLNPSDPRWPLFEESDPLQRQWQLVRRTVDLPRSSCTPFYAEELFNHKVGSWSSVAVPTNGKLAFCHILEFVQGGSEQGYNQEAVRILMARGAQRALASRLLEQMDKYK